MSTALMLCEGEINITIDVDCMCDIGGCTEPVTRIYVFENREVWQVCQKHNSEFYKYYMQDHQHNAPNTASTGQAASSAAQ